ncbi:MAG: twin-arginine translocation signal domain-containing protein, partial [Nocardioidaceae bacterium]|nr:twin-arginine translocation signal domain-containing protein [Nocardioidaceae bacterium]
MPAHPPPAAWPRSPSRRRFLLAAGAGAAAAGLAGCASAADHAAVADATEPTDVRASTDEVLAAAAARSAADLLVAYEATFRRHPGLSHLGPLAAHHAQHVEAFAQQPVANGRGARVPRSPRDALSALAAAESGIRERRVAA